MSALGWIVAIIAGVVVALVVRAIVFPRCQFPGDTLGLVVTGVVGGALGGALMPSSLVGVLLGGLNVVASILVAAAFTLLIGAICCCRCHRDGHR
ncbi:MAG TPA: hypothetical protein VIK99_11115 [Thermaerobacter sp.]